MSGDLHAWWREGVLSQVYPRSFADADGDGHGDLPGLRGTVALATDPARDGEGVDGVLGLEP